jgi:hypothetical protein
MRSFTRSGFLSIFASLITDVFISIFPSVVDFFGIPPAGMEGSIVAHDWLPPHEIS